MGKKDDYLRLEQGLILNFTKKAKELKESDFRSPEAKKLFNIFSGGDGVLDKNDYKNLWSLAKKFANQNGNTSTLDDTEKLDMLEEINMNLGEKFNSKALTDFLLKVFQKPDKIELEDSAQLNIPFMEIKEGLVQEQETLNDYAQRLFNPDDKEFSTKYYDDNRIKEQTIYDNNGNPSRIIVYDEEGISRVEIKTESGWEITDFTTIFGSFSIIKTGPDKKNKLSETIMSDKNSVYKKIEYYTKDGTSRIEYIYTDKNEYYSNITEYKNNKKVKSTSFDESGRIKETLEYIYDESFSNGKYPTQLRTYNARGELINLIDNITHKEYDGNGNEIKAQDINLEDAQAKKDKENLELASLLLDNISVQNFSKINSSNILEILNAFETLSIKFDENGNGYGRQQLIDKILSNPNNAEQKEQIKIITEALRSKIDKVINNNATASDSMLQNGKNKLNVLLDRCLKDSTDKTVIKENLEKVIYILENPFYEFSGFAYTDTPNGIIDKFSYQNRVGDCWLLSSLDAISEIKGGQEYLKQFIENDKEQQTVKIKLDGGKAVYKFSYEEIQNAYGLSIGDADMKAFEMAYEKYFKEFKPYGFNSIDGGWSSNAFQLLSGEKTVEAVIQNNKPGIVIDGDFVEINKQNREKLKHIPIDIYEITPEIIKQIKDIQDFTAITTTSYNDISAHAYYITDISEDGYITIKEPNSPNMAKTYTTDYFFKIYNDMTIFIM